MAKTPVVPRKAQKLNIQIDKGSTFHSALIWKIGDPALPKPLTGYTARMQLRSSIESETILHSMTTENGGISITALEGKIELTISAPDSTLFDFEEAVYDLELIDTGGSGDVRRLVEGDVALFDEVTR